MFITTVGSEIYEILLLNFIKAESYLVAVTDMTK